MATTSSHSIPLWWTSQSMFQDGPHLAIIAFKVSLWRSFACPHCSLHVQRGFLYVTLSIYEYSRWLYHEHQDVYTVWTQRNMLKWLPEPNPSVWTVTFSISAFAYGGELPFFLRHLDFPRFEYMHIFSDSIRGYEHPENVTKQLL